MKPRKINIAKINQVKILLHGLNDGERQDIFEYTDRLRGTKSAAGSNIYILINGNCYRYLLKYNTEEGWAEIVVCDENKIFIVSGGIYMTKRIYGRITFMSSEKFAESKMKLLYICYKINRKNSYYVLDE